MKVPFLDLNKVNHDFLPEIKSNFDKVFLKSNFILGDEVSDFEEKFASYCGSKYCVGLSSGTEALHLALRALDIGAGDEVITVSNTFVATVLAISYVGAVPILVDCDPISYNIDIHKLESKITSKTRAIIPVHLYGQVCDMDPIIKLARKYGLAVVEDSSQAHGAKYKDQRAGTLGDIGCFSFYPGKNLGAFGDAGCIITNNEHLNKRVQLLRNYGSPKKYFHDFIGFNARMDTIQAVVLRAKLKKLDEFNLMRVEAAATYTNLLKPNAKIVTPKYDNYGSHVFHLYVVQVENRDAVSLRLSEAGIQTVIHYPNPIYRLGAYQNLNLSKEQFPVTEMISRQILSLPIYPGISKEQIEYVCSKLCEYA
jgi:dTDP-4-amino-4,6-dideoxygalactose transaminase